MPPATIVVAYVISFLTSVVSGSVLIFWLLHPEWLQPQPQSTAVLLAVMWISSLSTAFGLGRGLRAGRSSAIVLGLWNAIGWGIFFPDITGPRLAGIGMLAGLLLIVLVLLPRSRSWFWMNDPHP